MSASEYLIAHHKSERSSSASSSMQAPLNFPMFEAVVSKDVATNFSVIFQLSSISLMASASCKPVPRSRLAS